LRKRLTRGAGDGQRCDDSKANLTNFLHHVGAPPCSFFELKPTLSGKPKAVPAVPPLRSVQVVPDVRRVKT
jgi:hypothetical protein